MNKLALLLIMSVIARAELFVSSHDSSQVYRFHETTGAFIDIFIPNTQPRLNAPHGLAFGPDGNLFVASAGNDRVLRYNGQTGAYIDDFITVNSGGLDYPVALIFRGTNLFVSSQLSNQVLRYNATTGAFIDIFVAASSVLNGPSDMQFGPDGNLYVVGRFNSRVVRYNGQTGTFMETFIGANLNQPFGLRFLPSGTLLVASGNDTAIQSFTSTGAFIKTFIDTGGLALPIGFLLGVDEILVASYNNDKVARYDMAGVFKSNITAAGLNGPNFMNYRPSPRPTLAINISADSVQLSWEGAGFHVVESASPTFESPVHHPTATNIITRLGAQQFFRLEKPY